MERKKMTQTNELKENVDYNFLIPENIGEEVNIQLTSGKFSGVIYNFGKVSIDEDKENDQAFLNFEYNIIDSNGLESLENNLEFKNHIGSVLTSIVLSKVGEFGDLNYEDGTDYTEEFDLQ